MCLEYLQRTIKVHKCMYSLLFMYAHCLMSYVRLIADYSMWSTVILLPYLRIYFLTLSN